MAEVLSPVRIARARRTSFQNVEETFEIDFELGLEQGLRVHAVEFGMREAIIVPTTAPLTAQVHMSLHVETGALEGAIDAFPADDVILNSEIIAETTYQVMSGDTAQIEGATSQEWLQPKSWNYHEIMGQALDLAQNLTFRVITSESPLTVNGGQVTIYYQYLKLTKAELGSQFILRR